MLNHCKKYADWIKSLPARKNPLFSQLYWKTGLGPLTVRDPSEDWTFFGKEFCAHGARTGCVPSSYGTHNFKHEHWMIQHDSHSTSIYDIFTYIIIFWHIIKDYDWRKYNFESKKIGFLKEW